MSGNLQNLDQLCARFGWEMADAVYREISKNAENHITKSLGVLQEDGVYAFFLYQVSRGAREKAGAELQEKAKELLKAAGIIGFQNVDNPLGAVRDHTASDLDHLLLAKRLLEKALIYARYHVKARG